MSLTTRAEVLADLSEAAAACAECFCRARCAGLDIKSIAATAKAAVTLGAELTQLHRNARPYPVDTEYLTDLEGIRSSLRDRTAECERLIRDADRQAEMAAMAMRAALAARPPDYAAYSLASATYQDAVCAAEIAGGTAITCDTAVRLLLTAEADFCWVYEQPETLVAAGHVLPHNGRWITGQHQAG